MCSAGPEPTGLARLRDLAAAYVRVPAGAPVRRVAVVGNAPMEPSDQRARQINNSDLVMRVNSFVADTAGDRQRRGLGPTWCSGAGW